MITNRWDEAWAPTTTRTGDRIGLHHERHNEAAETLGMLLRTLAAVGGDVDERHLTEMWIAHLLHGAAPPTRPTTAKAGEGPLDWSGLRGFVSRALENRAARTARTIDELRGNVSLLGQELRDVDDHDVHDDTTAREHLLSLQRALEHGDGELRATALTVARAWAELLDERRARRNERARSGSADVYAALAAALDDEAREAVAPAAAFVTLRSFERVASAAVVATTLFGESAALVVVDATTLAGGGAIVDDALLVAFARHEACLARLPDERTGVVVRGIGAVDAVRLVERAMAHIDRTASDAPWPRVCAGLAEPRLGDDVARFVARAQRGVERARAGAARGRSRIVGDDDER